MANYLYGTKYPETLSQGQKDTITSILNLATATAIYTATDGSTTDAVSGTEIGKVGVEWNGTVAVNAGINTTPIKGKGGELAVFVTSGDAFENFSIRNPKINWGEFDAGVAVTTSDTTGFGAGFGLGANYIRGGRSNIDATSSTASTCLLVGCFNIHNDSSGKYSGYGGAIGGNSKGGVAPGGSFTYSDNKTRTLTIRDFFKRRLQ
nr:VENN motif pre-toxin domain-containing protein [Moraxella sp. Tifton1]